MKNTTLFNYSLNQRKTFISYISWLAIFSTLFAGFSFIGNSLLGFFFAFLVIALNFSKLRLSTVQFLVIIFCCIYFSFVIFISFSYAIVLQNIRYWFGVLVYILLFKAYPDDRLISLWAIRFLIISVIFESLLINIFHIDSGIFHYGSEHLELQQVGFYTRPLSFAANPGSSAFALLVLFYLVEKLLCINAEIVDVLLLFVAIIALMSGSAILGFILLLVFRMFDAKPNSNILWIFGLCFIVLLVSLLFYIDFSEFQKLNINYYVDIYNIKIIQFGDVSQTSNALSNWLGSQLSDDLPTTSGDFGWLLLYEAMGGVGVACYFLIIFSFNYGGRALFPVLLLMLIGTIHYPAAMSPAGQMITAMILILPDVYNKTSIRSQTDNNLRGRG
jgi:hypothetical protein